MLLRLYGSCFAILIVAFSFAAIASETKEGSEAAAVIISADEQTADTQAATEPVAPAIPKAEEVDLDEPVLPEPEPGPEPGPTLEPGTEVISEPPVPAAELSPSPQKVVVEPELNKSLIFLGKEVQPGITTRLSWATEQSFEGIAAPTPVLVAHGSQSGPVLCITAAIHGDELNGIEIVRRILYDLNPEKLSGTVIGVPIVNLQGFHRSSRYLTDRRDLNRFFPGDPDGSSASRIAFSFFRQVIQQCNALVDLHTGSFFRTNLPQLRADLRNPEVVELTHGFGATVVLHSDGAEGTLRRAAVEAGIPAVTLEAGGPSQLQESAVSHGVKGIQTLLNKMGMYKKSSFWGDPEPVYYQSEWVRADQGGILFSAVELGQKVKQGTVLGTITNPITNIQTEVVSPYRGRVLGKAFNQVVQPGFAAFRIGIQKAEEEMIKDIPETTGSLLSGGDTQPKPKENGDHGKNGLKSDADKDHEPE